MKGRYFVRQLLELRKILLLMRYAWLKSFQNQRLALLGWPWSTSWVKL